jgi:beta-N-acetylhexosaminidase
MRAMIARLRAAAGGRLIAATDEEGNGICTNVAGIPCLSNSPADIGRMTNGIKTAGFNVNLAPIADVASIPNSIMNGRSYGPDAATDAADVGGAVDAIHADGMLATAKHFPGHGATSVSSETQLPIITTPLSTLESRDWVPFQAAMAHHVDFVMVGHLALSALDPGVPSTISKADMDALRGRLGYRGAVISDDMEMGGVTGTVPTPEAAVRFLVNGGDMVMVAHDLAVADQVFDAIKAAVLSGRLPRSRLDEAVSRLAALPLPPAVG